MRATQVTDRRLIWMDWTHVRAGIIWCGVALLDRYTTRRIHPGVHHCNTSSKKLLLLKPVNQVLNLSWTANGGEAGGLLTVAGAAVA